MLSREVNSGIAVFDLGGTWFRWGLYGTTDGLLESWRSPAINYLSHPHLSAAELQQALAGFITDKAHELRRRHRKLVSGSISVGAPVNAHDETVLGSGPLWGPTAQPFRLKSSLCEAIPELEWHVLNDITALLVPYMGDCSPERMYRKTLLITISTGIGSRLYDHHTGRIPYEPVYGIQGEIGHLTLTFELDGRIVSSHCECGAPNHLNAFCSGRGIAQILRRLPELSPRMHGRLSADSTRSWGEATDDYRLSTFKARLDAGDDTATALLDAFVTPVSRTLAAALSLDPEIDRIILTGGVAHGLGHHYRQSLHRTFLRDGLYQISVHDPQWLARRLHWEDPDDFGGLRGAGIYATHRIQQ